MDETLIMQVEYVLNGQNTHKINALLNLYRFCSRVQAGKKYSDMGEAEQQLWKNMLPKYEAALIVVRNSKGTIIPDLTTTWLEEKQRLGVTDLQA